MAPKPLTAQDLMNLAGVFSGMLGGQFRKLAGQSGVLPPARVAPREGIEVPRGVFQPPTSAARPTGGTRVRLDAPTTAPTPSIRRPEPPVAGVFQPPLTPAVRSASQPPIQVPTPSQVVTRPPVDIDPRQVYGPSLQAPSPSVRAEQFIPEGAEVFQPSLMGRYNPQTAQMPPSQMSSKLRRGATTEFEYAPGGTRTFSDETFIGPLQAAPTPRVRAAADAAGTTYDQLPLNLRTDITSAWSPKGAAMRNALASLQGKLPLLAGLGAAGVGATVGMSILGGGEETPLGPTTGSIPGSVEEQTAPNNVDAAASAAQSEAARAAAADLAAGATAARTQRYSDADSNLRQARQSAEASARLDPSRTGGAATRPTRGDAGAPADYRQIAQYYAARRQEALKPKSVDETILQLQASGALDKPGIAQWAAANPVLAYELNQKLRARDISQQSQNNVGATITAPLGSNVQNLVPGSTQGLIDAAEGRDPAIKDVTNAAVSTTIEPMPKELQAFFARAGFQNRAY